jgi:hypothetical protein
VVPSGRTTQPASFLPNGIIVIYVHIFVLIIPHFSVIVSKDSFKISKRKEITIFKFLG